MLFCCTVLCIVIRGEKTFVCNLLPFIFWHHVCWRRSRNNWALKSALIPSLIPSRRRCYVPTLANTANPFRLFIAPRLSMAVYANSTGSRTGRGLWWFCVFRSHVNWVNYIFFFFSRQSTNGKTVCWGTHSGITISWVMTSCANECVCLISITSWYPHGLTHEDSCSNCV